LIVSVKFAITCTFTLAACLLGQDRGGTPPGEGRMQIGDVFSSADASGSLEYWGVCNFKEFYPDFPKLQALPNHEGPAVELLRQIFSVNPKMRVNQDSEGRIRMVEEDVPTDLLDVKINHLRFPPEYYGPLVAVSVIGFWMYENCQSPAGGRIVWLGFLENAPSPVRVETHK
jgi:hypothetical protein